MTISPPASTRSSYQAPALNTLNLQPKDLGYTPFEYWKGPKPVIPGSKRTQGPIASGRTTTIAVTALDTSSGPKAQQLSSAVASSFPYEKQPPYGSHAASGHKKDMGWDDTYNGARSAGPTSFQVHDHNGAVELVTGQPPSYFNAQLPPREMHSESQWDPRGWRKRTWAGIAIALIIAIVVGVAVGVMVAKANRYPDYSKLTYSLQDTCKSTHST